MDIKKESLGLFSNCILFLVKEHEPSKTIFNTIHQGFMSYTNAIIKATDGKCSVAQTGSSFDELHLSRYLHDDVNGRDSFYPPIDFDLMMSFDEYKILDKSTVDSLDKEKCAELRKIIKFKSFCRYDVKFRTRIRQALGHRRRSRNVAATKL